MGKTQKFTLADIRKFGKSLGLTFLNDEYFGMLKKHRWRCRAGHVFWATPSNLKFCSKGCPRCSRVKLQVSIEQIRRIAKKQKISILETEPLGLNNPHRAECMTCGHRFRPRPKNLAAGTGCPRCHRFKRSYKQRWWIELSRYLDRLRRARLDRARRRTSRRRGRSFVRWLVGRGWLELYVTDPDQDAITGS